MAKILNSRKIIYFFLVLLLLNFKLTKQIKPFEMSIEKGHSELGIFHKKYELNNVSCPELIPSLFNPIFIINTQGYESSEIKTISKIVPVFSLNKNLTLVLFNYTFLDNLEEYNLVLGEERFSDLLKKCYFGLASKNTYYNLDQSEILLNRMFDEKKITKKIFSFDKWKISNQSNLISTTLYIGEEHNNFKLKSDNKKGIIGNCLVNESYDYWGCSFNAMSINNITKDLKKNDRNDYYEIYFSTETHDIIFPDKFYTKFHELTEQKCTYDKDNEKIDFTICKGFFNNDGYASLKLISSDMNITIEIDNQERFCEKNEDKKNFSRIKFKDINYIILPLIMFKNFDIQFDAENNRIQFYTTDNSILQLRKERKKNKSSNGVTVFLIIFIIILILALGFGIFWFIKKRRGSIEKNINKYNKFDEDENFQSLNEKRVF